MHIYTAHVCISIFKMNVFTPPFAYPPLPDANNSLQSARHSIFLEQDRKVYTGCDMDESFDSGLPRSHQLRSSLPGPGLPHPSCLLAHTVYIYTHALKRRSVNIQL